MYFFSIGAKDEDDRYVKIGTVKHREKTSNRLAAQHFRKQERCCRVPVNINAPPPLSITPAQTHFNQPLSERGGLQVGMQINPQVNTNIIRSVTLQYCPRGMCEFHLEISQTGDNSANRGPSDIPPPIKLAKKIKQIQIQKSEAEAGKSQGSQTVSEA